MRVLVKRCLRIWDLNHGDQLNCPGLCFLWTHVKVSAKGLDNLETNCVYRVQGSHRLLEDVCHFLAAHLAQLGLVCANHFLAVDLDTARDSSI